MAGDAVDFWIVEGFDDDLVIGTEQLERRVDAADLLGDGRCGGDEDREGEGAQAGQWHEHRRHSGLVRGAAIVAN